jgi:chromosome segregation ATPase
MSHESYADFSIIKKYFEVINKYDLDVQSFKDKLSGMEERFNHEIMAYKKEIATKTALNSDLQKQVQELSNAIKEKDEMLKNLGLQLHKVKTELTSVKNQPAADDDKKGKFSIFK